MVGEAGVDVVQSGRCRAASARLDCAGYRRSASVACAAMCNCRTGPRSQESLRNSACDSGTAVIVAASTTTRDSSFCERCAVSGEVACQPSFAASAYALTRYGGQVAATAATSVRLGESLGAVGTATLDRKQKVGLPTVARSEAGQARLRAFALRRATSACIHERRLVDQTGIEPVTS